MFNRKTLAAALLILIAGIPAAYQPRPTAVAGVGVECYEDGSGIEWKEDGTHVTWKNEDPTSPCYSPLFAD